MLVMLLLPSPNQAEWIELDQGAAKDAHLVVMSALERHWLNARRGWCRSIANLGLEDEPYKEIELSWSGDIVGVQIRDASKNIASGAPLGPIESVSTFSLKEVWLYHPQGRSMTGQSSSRASIFRTELDCRPQKMWLSPHQGHVVEWTHGYFLSRKGKYKISRDSDRSLLRVAMIDTVQEFDEAADYSPVLFEAWLNHEGTLPKGARPRREKYTVSRDTHGVWFCRSVEITEWPEGESETPWIHVPFTVLEYDSQPPPEKMRIDYNSIGADPGTRVTSLIPSRPGSWVYGRPRSNDAQLEKVLREVGEQMRTRGFSKSPSAGE